MHGTDCSDKGETDMINFEEEIEHFKPSLEVEDIGEAIVRSDLTDMTDIMMELMKELRDRRKTDGLHERIRCASNQATIT